jgi:hypothetical protein
MTPLRSIERNETETTAQSPRRPERVAGKKLPTIQ